MTTGQAALWAPSERFRVFGIDGATGKTGWGVVDARGNKRRRAAGGVLRPSASKPLAWRLWFMFDRLCEKLDEHRPDFVVVEEPVVGRNPQSSLKVGMASGAAQIAAVDRDIRVERINVSTLKKSVTGYGKATKAQVQAAVRAQLGLDALPPEDEADALGAALYGCVRWRPR